MKIHIKRGIILKRKYAVIQVEKEIIINSPEKMVELGINLGKLLEPNMVIALSGDLGAGKTTFTKGIGKALEITDTINSPTYTILKIYYGRMPLFHMDVYRINKHSQDNDLEEFFEQDGVCVIEWADNIAYLLPKDYLKIDIKDIGNDHRLVTLQANNHQYEKIIESVQL